jgi:hypothetical protein
MPSALGTQGLQGFDQHGGLDRHVQLPVMRAPFRGWALANSSRMAIRPGISVSAMLSSLRPQGARLRSAMACSLRVQGFENSAHGHSKK